MSFYELRGYFNPDMPKFLEEYGVVKLKEDANLEDLKQLKSDLGLFSEKGNSSVRWSVYHPNQRPLKVML